jgi:hypothetical protein
MGPTVAHPAPEREDNTMNDTNPAHAGGNPWTVVCGTGHRQLPPDQAEWMRGQLARCAVWLRDVAGTQVGISGFARGFDLWWADAVVKAGLELWAYIPFEEQSARWTSRRDREEWQRLRAAATQDRERIIGVVGPDVPPARRSTAVTRLLHARNDAMLRDAGAVVAGWEAGRLDGGTHGALVKAVSRGMPGVHLDPAVGRPQFELPHLDRLLKYVLYHTVCGHVAAVAVLADMERRRSELAEAGDLGWRIRPARPRETPDASCPTCQIEQAHVVAARG